MNVSVPPKQISIYAARKEKEEVSENFVLARKRKVSHCSYPKSSKRKPVRQLSGNLQYLYTFLEKRVQKKSLEGKYNEQPQIAIDVTQHTVRTTDIRILYRKLISTPLKCQRETKKDMSPSKHQLRGPSANSENASPKTRKVEEGIVSSSNPNVRKVEVDKEDSDFECYNKSAVNQCIATSIEKLPKENRHLYYYQTDRKKMKKTITV